ncbi:MAG TPA: HAD family hydrolase [Terriglobales bacterium]|nr:HAD family hydrolase [Terriglobales bacterium]
MRLRAAIFDLDGTVVENAYDWAAIRREIGDGGLSILSYLNGLEEPERSRKWAILERHEAEQTARSVLREGMRELLDFLKAKGVRTALVTNNSRPNTAYILGKFGLAFDRVTTRESGLWKPSGAPFRDVLEAFGARAEEACVIGDTRFDVLAAEDAGIGLVFLLFDDPFCFAGLPVEVFPGLVPLQRRLESLV